MWAPLPVAVLVVAALAHPASAAALSFREARQGARAAYAQAASTLDARVHVAHCARLSRQKVACRVFIVGPGTRCSVRVRVAETADHYVIRARGLRCRAHPA